MASTNSSHPEPGRLPVRANASYPAGFFSRLEAFVIDLVFLSIIEMGISAFIQAFLRFFQLSTIAANLQAIWANSAINMAVGVTFSILFVIGYFTFFWSLVGFTPGKAVLGLKVVRKDGQKMSFGRSVLRFFSYWISALPLFLGFFWVLWDPNRRGWHDKIAGTQVLFTPKNLRK
jgi:uncharacterized RDD family membrane protein YckC